VERQKLQPAGDDQPVVDLVSDDDEDVKPAVKKEGGGGGSSSGGGRYGGGRHGGERERNGGGGGIGYYRRVFRIPVKSTQICYKYNEVGGFYEIW
jgi:hypothetical protein